MALPKQMIKDAKRQKRLQDADRLAAGEMWEDYGLVWCQPNGKPIDAHDDWEAGKPFSMRPTSETGVHDGRHTAATMLLVQGVDEATVMAIMGRSSKTMLKRYQHVVDELRLEAARRLGDMIYVPSVEQYKAKANTKKNKQKDEIKKLRAELEILKAKNIDFSNYATETKIAKVIPTRRQNPVNQKSPLTCVSGLLILCAARVTQKFPKSFS